MITENLSTLKIHKLTQAQYNRELESGNIDENELYLTPDITDQSYNPMSEYPQSGKAVKEALDALQIPNTADQSYDSISENAQSGKAVAEAINTVQTSVVKTVSGDTINISDISPIEHILSVRASSKNKITSISQHQNVNITDGVVTQINADTRANLLYKIVTTTNGGVVGVPATLTTNELGRHSMSFTIKEGLTQLVFGLGGTQRDATVKLNLLPPGTYTISWETTNVTQGSISWKDMQIEEGIMATNYTPHVEDLSIAKVIVNEEEIYPINAVGTVEGIKSTYPATTLTSDTEGIVFDIEYYSQIGLDYISKTYISKTEISNGAYTLFYNDEHDSMYRIMTEEGDQEEWQNPPMFPNVEYRTTERYNGCPVYVQKVHILSNGDKTSFNGDYYYDFLNNVEMIVDISAMLHDWTASGLSDVAPYFKKVDDNIRVRIKSDELNNCITIHSLENEYTGVDGTPSDLYGEAVITLKYLKY